MGCILNHVSQNPPLSDSVHIKGICDFDQNFLYVLPGWEGSAHDSRVLNYALADDLRVPGGRYSILFG